METIFVVVVKFFGVYHVRAYTCHNLRNKKEDQIFARPFWILSEVMLAEKIRAQMVVT